MKSKAHILKSNEKEKVLPLGHFGIHLTFGF
jgi:hypothetical protein